MDQKKAQLLMAAVIVSRSVSYLFTKFAMQSMEIFNILGVRFLLAFLILAVIFRRKLRALSGRALLRGAILGGLLFAIMALELTALKTTDTSTTSFLENTAIIFVPLFTALLERRFPDRDASFHAVLAVAGIEVDQGKKVAEDYHCDFYEDFDAMLSRDDIDMVTVALPTFLHEKFVLMAAKYGKHVVCEKPVTMSLESFERMAAATKEAGVKFMVAQCIRFWPVTSLWKDYC